MNGDQLDLELIRAETHLARALQRLSALRRAALYGSFDVRTFDEAVMEYRAAEGEVLEMRKAWARRNEAAANAALTEDEEITPIEPTPRLLFARWLFQTGRLSDWDASGQM